MDLPRTGRVRRCLAGIGLIPATAHGGVEHRAALGLTLTPIGAATPDLDGWPCCVAAGYRPAI